MAKNKQHIAHDDVMILTRLQGDMDRVVPDHRQVRLTATKEMKAAA